MLVREVPGGPVVRTWCFHGCGWGSIPGQGANILQAGWPKTNMYVKEGGEAGCLMPPYPCAEASEGENAVLGFSLCLEPFLIIASQTLHLPSTSALERQLIR